MNKEQIKQRILQMVPDKGSYDAVNEVCQYRGPNGGACAVGAFIEDSDYDPFWDSLDSPIAVEGLPGHVRAKLPFGLSHMKALQKIHDDMVFADKGGIPQALCAYIDSIEE